MQLLIHCCVKFFNVYSSHEEEWRVAEQAGREKFLKGNVKHVLLYTELVWSCEFNILSYVYHDLNNRQDRSCYPRHEMPLLSAETRVHNQSNSDWNDRFSERYLWKFPARPAYQWWISLFHLHYKINCSSEIRTAYCPFCREVFVTCVGEVESDAYQVLSFC